MKLVRFSILVITVLVVLDLIVGFCSCSEEEFVAMANLGGLRDVGESNQNKLELEELAKFAVDEHNKKQNTVLEFGKLVKAKEQVVAGTMYYLTLEAIDAGTKKIYEAKVWVKPWLNFKELQEFKQVGDGSFSSSDVGANQG